MMERLVAATVVGVVLWIGKSLMIRLILGKRFHHWIQSTAIGLGIQDLCLTVLGGMVLAEVHAEGLTALFVLTAFGACTTLNIMVILGARKGRRAWNAIF